MNGIAPMQTQNNRTFVMAALAVSLLVILSIGAIVKLTTTT
jgi:hypothetical protein